VNVLASNLALALDPCALGPLCSIDLDEWQARALRSPARRQSWNACRQSGKSTTASLKTVAVALTEPGSLSLLVSPSQRQSGELFRRTLSYAKQAGAQIKSESALRCELHSGSRIISLPGEEGTIRGYSGARLIVIDEASRVPDEIYTAVRPMMATVRDAQMVCLSTPKGRRGWWWKEWTEGSGWERVSVPVTMCPRITPEFLQEELKSLGAKAYAEEYELQFMDADDSAFSTAAIDAAFTDEVRVLWR